MRKKWSTFVLWGKRLILAGFTMMIIGGLFLLFGHWFTVPLWYGGAAVVVVGACMVRIAPLLTDINVKPTLPLEAR